MSGLCSFLNRAPLNELCCETAQEALAREEEAGKRKAVELFQEVAQRYQDKKYSDPDREEREQHAARVQGLLVDNQELLQVGFQKWKTLFGTPRTEDRV